MNEETIRELEEIAKQSERKPDERYDRPAREIEESEK